MYYVYESPTAIIGSTSTYDFQLLTDTLDYGVASQSGPKAIRVYQNGSEIPFDDNNGYTYDAVTQRLSLHGTYRPQKYDFEKKYLVYSITADDLKANIPQNSYIYKVELNGKEIQETQDSSGNGYFYDGDYVEIVGDSRPNITNSSSEISLKVQYLDSLEIDLNTDAPSSFFNQYCDHEAGKGLLDAEIDPTNLLVFWDGNILSADQYTLDGTKIMLNRDSLNFTIGSHNLSVDFRVRQPVKYQANKFDFQVGANTGQKFKIEIESFDNMLKDTNIICVRTHQDAKKGLQVIDKALDFVLRQRGSIGAIENTLDRITSNLAVLEENTTSSLSRIEDADMAKEMMNLTKNSILSQASQAMLAQANQQSQGVLQLLK